MGVHKTAAPCEVCGQRCKHAGTDLGFLVGYTVKNVPRLVHERCRSKWRERKDAIMYAWRELQPEVFSTLSPELRHRIERCLAQQRGVHVARERSQEAFPYPAEVRSWLMERLTIMPRRKGNIKAWFKQLQKDHPTWMPRTYTNTHYNDFRGLIIDVETQIRQRTSVPAPVPPTPQPGTEIMPPSVTTVMDGDDLPAMAAAVNALTALALKRQDRESIQLALEAMSHLLQPPKKTPTA